MSTRIYRSFISCLSLGIIVCSLTSQVAADISKISDVSPGAPAPDFTLVDQDGKNQKVSDFKGKILVLEWLNPECPFVQRHAKAKTMKKLAESYVDKGVLWLGINSTHWATSVDNAKYRSEYELPYPILLDADGKAGKAYGAKTTPHMFIIDKDGRLAYKGAIDSDPAGEEALEKRTPHVQQALDELLAGKPVSHAETTSYGCSVKYGG